ncbi:hypothetical protein CYY_006053 [Polysphondylium violaceum]|uniref:Biogenesis of lysosome-related organelles complex 1 subunit 6 n=1 Tax=Polysphondylium violaceum TaxID=133409 RepID=A0A8J4UYE7_9MYCE|nr:hypothetical protein CYY_006053 [Polysphondylium violaceum]
MSETQIQSTNDKDTEKTVDTTVVDSSTINTNKTTTATATTTNLPPTEQEPTDNYKPFNPLSLAIPDLTEGLLLINKIPLDAITLKLNELQQEQLMLLNSLKNENIKLHTIKNIDVIVENFKKISEYLIKIQNLKKDMIHATDKMNRLTDKTNNLKEKKKQYQISLNDKYEKALQRERDLTVKPSPELQQNQQQQQQQPHKHHKQHTLNSNITL